MANIHDNQWEVNDLNTANRIAEAISHERCNSIVYFHNRRVGENGRVTRHSGSFGLGSLNGDTGRRIE